MQTIQTRVQIEADRTLTVQLPAEIQTGEYEIVLVLNSSVSSEKPAIEPASEEEQKRLNEVWEALIEEVEEVPIVPTPVSSEYQQSLIEKYQKQGLEL